MEDNYLKEIIRAGFSFLMKYKHPEPEIVKDLRKYLESKFSFNGFSLDNLAARMVLKFTYGGCLEEDKKIYVPKDFRKLNNLFLRTDNLNFRASANKYQVATYKLKNNFNLEETIDNFFDTLIQEKQSRETEINFQAAS